MTHSTMMRVSAFMLYGLALVAVPRMTACAGGPPLGTGGAGGASAATSTPPAGTGGTKTTSSTPPTGSGGTGGTQPGTGTQPACEDAIEVPCMRYHIPLVGNPSFDIPLRNKYIAAFGDACYMSDADPSTFNCYYKKWWDACADAAKIGDVAGVAPYEQGHTCQLVDGSPDYSLDIGWGQTIYIDYLNAPRQTPLTDIDGVPTAVNGLYRNLTDPAQVGPGLDFSGNSGVPDGDGGVLTQQKWVLQVNRNANNGKIRSDLAGFEWLCEGSDGGMTKCVEPEYLDDPAIDAGPDASIFHAYVVAQVHHVVPMKDLRCCPFGTNTYKNAAVISAKLNWFFSNNNPPVEEVSKLNKAKPY